jgi:hypothetical protein
MVQTAFEALDIYSLPAAKLCVEGLLSFTTAIDL